MTDRVNNGGPSGPSASVAAGEQPQAKVRVVGQYIKDLSFENPNVNKLIDGPGENPNLALEVNVNASQVGPDLFESAIEFKAHVTNKVGVIYDLELIYAGMFRLEQMPQQAMQPFLLINCPALLFPFLRRLVADLTREGGFPPLLLDPIDFAQLYMRKQQEAAAGAQSGKPTTQ